MELELSSRLSDGSSFDINYTYQFAENEQTNEIQHHIPMHKANAGFNYRYSQFVTAYLGAVYSGKLSAKGVDSYDTNSLKEKTSIDTSINFSNKADTPTGIATPPRHFSIPEQDRHVALKLSYKL